METKIAILHEFQQVLANLRILQTHMPLCSFDFVFKGGLSLVYSHALHVSLTSLSSDFCGEVMLCWAKRVNCTPSCSNILFWTSIGPTCWSFLSVVHGAPGHALIFQRALSMVLRNAFSSMGLWPMVLQILLCPRFCPWCSRRLSFEWGVSLWYSRCKY